MSFPHSAALLSLLALCAGCAAPDPPVQVPGTLASNQRPEMLVRLGDDMRRSGDAAGAVNLYRAASQSAPHDPVVLERMGEAFLAINDATRAEQAFRGALALDPGDAAGQRGLALALLAQGRAAEALPILQAQARNSTDPALLRADGTALDMVGQPGDAQAVYRRGLQASPIDADLHGNLALSLALSGDATNALAEMQAAIASPDPDPRQDTNAVLVLALTGNADAAQVRGDATIGAAATQELLARAQRALAATDARSRAIAIGLLTGNGSGPATLATTLLPPVTGPSDRQMATAQPAPPASSPTPLTSPPNRTDPPPPAAGSPPATR